MEPGMAIALTSTVHHLDKELSLWCQYHLALFDIVILWIDDASEFDSRYLPSNPRLIVRLGSQLQHTDILARTMLRQNMNANIALKICTAHKISWLAHLDSDELLVCPNGSRICDYLNGNDGQVTMINHEMWPVWEADNIFADDHYFKLNGRYPLNFYGNGKSIVRCDAGVRTTGPHGFAGYRGSSRVAESIFVLHYPCPTFAKWKSKYETLGCFADYWWADQRFPIALPFHLESRDIYQRYKESGDLEEAIAFWRSQLLEDSQRMRLIEEGRIALFKPLTEPAGELVPTSGVKWTQAHDRACRGRHPDQGRPSLRGIERHCASDSA